MHFKDKRVLEIHTPEDMLTLLREKGNPLSSFKKGVRIHVYNKMEQGRSYVLQEDPGKNFDPEFKPELTPAQMLSMGVFEGKYLNDCLLQFPAEWFLTALRKKKLSPGAPNIECNYFKVKSRMSLHDWATKGWVPGVRGAVSKQHPILSCHRTNPHLRGYFQWYCEYWCGARNPELDAVQIARWKAFNRHVAQVRKNCKKGDIECHTRQRMALLQWGFNPLI